MTNILPPKIESILKTIGNNIKTARKKRKMSKKDFAKRVAVSVPTITRLEQGNENISIGTLLTALWILQLHKDMENIALPANDNIGNSYNRDFVKKMTLRSLLDE